MRLTNKLCKDERGAALLEMAVITPVLVILAAGLFEFGRILYQHQLIETGVRDAARYLSRRPTPSADETAAKELAVMGAIGGTTKRVSWWTTSNVTITYPTVANPIDGATGERTYRGPDPIKMVRVTTSATYSGIGMLAAIGLSAPTIGYFHEERVIGE